MGYFFWDIEIAFRDLVTFKSHNIFFNWYLSIIRFHLEISTYFEGGLIDFPLFYLTENRIIKKEGKKKIGKLSKLTCTLHYNKLNEKSHFCIKCIALGKK